MNDSNSVGANELVFLQDVAYEWSWPNRVTKTFVASLEIINGVCIRLGET